MLFKAFAFLLAAPIFVFGDVSTSYLYIGNQAPDQLVEYDASIGTPGTITALHTGLPISMPSGMALSSDGATLYITSAVNTSLLSYDINLDMLSVLPITGDTLTGCYGIAFVPGDSGNDILYVSDYNNNAFFSYNLLTTELTDIPTGGTLSNPTAVILNADGTTIYILNSGNNTIVAYDLMNQTFTPLTVTPDGTNPGALDRPYGGALSADGSVLYICNFNSNELDAYDIETTTLTNLNALPAILDGPVSIALNDEGIALYIANINNSTISSYDIASHSLTNVVVSTPSLISQPRCLALHRSAAPSPVVNPPTGLTGYQNTDDFGLIYELVNSIHWNPSISDVAGYRVYCSGILLATLSPSTYQYTVHNVKKGDLLSYSVTAFDSLGTESSPVVITIP